VLLMGVVLAGQLSPIGLGWFGHAQWTFTWAALFLYVSVFRWRSVGGAASVVGAVEAFLATFGLLPECVRKKWAAKEEAAKKKKTPSQLDGSSGDGGGAADDNDGGNDSKAKREDQSFHLEHTDPIVGVAMVFSMGFVFIGCLILISGPPLNGSVNHSLTLFLFDVAILYPVALNGLFEFMAWAEANFKVTAIQDDDGDGTVECHEILRGLLDKDGDGSVSVFECCSTLSSSTVYFLSAFMVFLHLCFWANALLAVSE
jgi:hypothetical protein